MWARALHSIRAPSSTTFAARPHPLAQLPAQSPASNAAPARARPPPALFLLTLSLPPSLSSHGNHCSPDAPPAAAPRLLLDLHPPVAAPPPAATRLTTL